MLPLPPCRPTGAPYTVMPSVAKEWEPQRWLRADWKSAALCALSPLWKTLCCLSHVKGFLMFAELFTSLLMSLLPSLISLLLSMFAGGLTQAV